MHLVKRVVGAGLATMAVVAAAAAIWPVVAGLVAGLLVTVLCTAIGTLGLLGGRWARAELAWRRELRTMPSLGASPYGDAAAGATLAQLRESA